MTPIPDSVRARARALLTLADECHTLAHPECHDAQHAKALAVCEYIADDPPVGRHICDEVAELAAWAISEEEP